MLTQKVIFSTREKFETLYEIIKKQDENKKSGKSIKPTLKEN